MKFWTLLSLVAASATLVAENANGDNWARFRGPNGTGVSDATTVPVEWTEDDYNWDLELAGAGISSPVVWNQRVFVTSADLAAGERYLYAVNVSDGKVAWRKSFPFGKHPKHKNNSFASNSPAVDAAHVYVVWQAKNGSTLEAWTHDGTRVWQYDLGSFKGGHGPATSPIVVDGKVVFCNDHEGDSFIVAVDAASGKEIWKVTRSGERACYSTPCVLNAADGESQLIFTHSYQGITSLDPDNGKLNWSITPFGTFKQRAIASPIVANGLVIAGSGFTTGERNFVAVAPPESDDGKVKEVYRVTKFAPHIPTPISYEGHLFLWDDRGIVACVDKTSGKEVWVKRVGGSYFGSPVCVNGRIYCADRDGKVVVLAASADYKLLAENSIGEGTCATPAVANGSIIFRTDSHLISIGGE